METMTLTDKQKSILDIIKVNYPNGAFAEEVVEHTEGITIAGVRAVLVSLAKKNLVSKTKAPYDGKEKTKYTLV